jgi:hypothetical protein
MLPWPYVKLSTVSVENIAYRFKAQSPKRGNECMRKIKALTRLRD